MIILGRKTDPHQRRIAVAAACLALGWFALMPLASAQDAVPPPDAAQTAQPPEKRGVFDSVGRFFERGATRFREHLSGAKRKWDELGDDAAANNRNIGNKASEAQKNAAAIGKNAADATKSAVEAVGNLATGRVISGRERCIAAPNGAPDCLAAAETLCRKQGFSTGKSMDFTSAEDCSSKAMLGQPAECTTVTFINRAMCQ
jgi:hypothetical protein